MEVFGIGPFELLLVILIGFIVLGPERIPDVARSVGKTIRQIRQSIQQFTTDSGEKINVADDLAALRREVVGLQKDLTRMTHEVLSPAVRTPTPPDPPAPTVSPSDKPDTPPASESDIIDMGAPPKA
jgi:Tat protein translocase TatB subunit